MNNENMVILQLVKFIFIYFVVLFDGICKLIVYFFISDESNYIKHLILT